MSRTKATRDVIDMVTRPVTEMIVDIDPASTAGSRIDNMPIGQTTPQVGNFTSIVTTNIDVNTVLDVTGATIIGLDILHDAVTEKFEAGAVLPTGTIVAVGSTDQIEIASLTDENVVGVVHATQSGNILETRVSLMGKATCRVSGVVSKGEPLYANAGVGYRLVPGTDFYPTFGYALVDKVTAGESLIDVFVTRRAEVPVNPWVPVSATTTVQGIMETATDAETAAGTDATRAVTPASLHSNATVGALFLGGMENQATLSAAELAGLDDDAWAIVDVSDPSDAGTFTPRRIPRSVLIPKATTAITGRVELATDAEALAGTDTERALTPSRLMNSAVASKVVETGFSNTAVGSAAELASVGDSSYILVEPDPVGAPGEVRRVPFDKTSQEYTAAAAAPASPNLMDFWFDTGTGTLFLYQEDGVGTQTWVQVSPDGASAAVVNADNTTAGIMEVASAVETRNATEFGATGAMLAMNPNHMASASDFTATPDGTADRVWAKDASTGEMRWLLIDDMPIGANAYKSSAGIPSGTIPLGSLYVDDAGDGSQYIRVNDGTNDVWIQIAAGGGGGGGGYTTIAGPTLAGTKVSTMTGIPTGISHIAIHWYDTSTNLGGSVGNANGIRFASGGNYPAQYFAPLTGAGNTPVVVATHPLGIQTEMNAGSAHESGTVHLWLIDSATNTWHISAKGMQTSGDEHTLFSLTGPLDQIDFHQGAGSAFQSYTGGSWFIRYI